MTYTIGTNVSRRAEVASRINVFGSRVLRYGLVLVIGWIGLMKFIGYEARGIEPFVAHSPLLGWGYHIWRVRQFSAGLGVVEIVIAILIDVVKTYRAV
jgi:reactive chlorine resistance protein C